MSKPILFSAPMVRALLDGSKTQTRRAWKVQPDDDGRVDVGQTAETRGIAYVRGASGGQCTRVPCPYGTVGSLLWVKEAYRLRRDQDHKRPSDDWWKSGASSYCADDSDKYSQTGCGGAAGRYRHARFMPRWASRITLRLTDVRVQQVQDISGADAESEGAECRSDLSWEGHAEYEPQKWVSAGYIAGFRDTWNTINAKRGYGWDANPWVWALTFDVLKQNIDEVIDD